MNSYKKDNKICHDIHIWIGDESTQDEYGTAAYKMVELDNKLGGIATQHREVQEHESAMFMGYFHNKVTYLDGGIESGFRHVEPTKENPNLFHIKGHIKSGTIRMTQEPLRRDAMNSGDVFVLVAGDDLVWMWIGKSANKDEKTKGMEVAKSFCTKGSVKVLDEGVNDGLQEAKEFWSRIKTEVSLLGPLPIKRKVRIQKADNKDDKASSYVATLYRIPEKLGSNSTKVTKAKMNKSKHPTMKKSVLKETEAFLLDTGFHVYIWIGKSAKSSIRTLAVHHAETYFNSQKRPVMPVSILKQGQENSIFLNYFEEGGNDGCAVM